MSPEDPGHASTADKIVRMANQIGTFFLSKPREEGMAGVAEHINKFWDPRMRRTFFALLDAGDARFLPLVRDASATIRRPAAPERPAGQP